MKKSLSWYVHVCNVYVESTSLFTVFHISINWRRVNTDYVYWIHRCEITIRALNTCRNQLRSKWLLPPYQINNTWTISKWQWSGLNTYVGTELFTIYHNFVLEGRVELVDHKFSRTSDWRSLDTMRVLKVNCNWLDWKLSGIYRLLSRLNWCKMTAMKHNKNATLASFRRSSDTDIHLQKPRSEIHDLENLVLRISITLGEECLGENN